VKAALSELESAIGYSFSNPDLLVRALTHRSLAHEQAAENGAGNERLEFLGDAVLGLVVAESLFLRFPEWREGELTRLRAQLVSRQNIGQVAAAIELGSYLRLSPGEDRTGLRRIATVLSNAMEAVLGAMFLDGGLDPVRGFVERRVIGHAAEELARELRSGEALGNYKSALQERLQADHLGTPVYKVKSESGPDHRKRFLVEVRLKHDGNEPGKPLARGTGTTKEHAEQDAARRALARLEKLAVAPEVSSEAAAEPSKGNGSRISRTPASRTQESRAE
jgi:ribonuclease III